MTLAIDCQNLVKTYPGKPPVEAVRGIDFQVKVGECFGVLGPNGAGKTTTIEILEGLLPATSGTASILGMDWRANASKIRERIGVSLQETQLSDRLTVGETLRLFRSFYSSGITPDEAMRRVSLEAKENSWIKTLSGGQKQRLAVATALVGDPELIFLDEPTTGLDPTSRRQLWEIIESFKAQNRTVMLTTHYMEEAERLCDRVAVFDAGKIIAEGSPQKLIQSLGANHVIEFSVGDSSDGKSVDWIERLPSVSQVQVDEDNIRITADYLHEVLPGLVAGLEREKISLTGLSTREATLEDVFVNLTGKHLSDGT
ncbi:ABC transporter ATP-binding protein [Mariniblastus fucicola]|uniref:Daunorubicin/doxorubicin resistance ATP-binding protein DrrA n=1 Tax=Mariniblastus fucicola TaxID=980251 RepID=A0A5B9PQE6_9BACT|nr:ABC transporter ATP-binding protein [Mariniblastus fucicola]QEG24701.1 Daunorubicin/doxorubicin resistance ATP-binding protein DrrA [Mariniblastus fucicola]